MSDLSCLKEEALRWPEKRRFIGETLLAEGFRAHYDDPVPVARAFALKSLLGGHQKHLYDHDLIAGSIRGLWSETADEAESKAAEKIVGSYGRTSFLTNRDHFAPDYETLLEIGVGGILDRIGRSRIVHKDDADFEKKRVFLDASELSMRAFGDMIAGYARAAEKRAAESGNESRFSEIASACRAVVSDPPHSFRQALQLVWLAHVSFVCERRYAMALGRLDQYLYPFYRHDVESGLLDRAGAVELLACTLVKIGEYRAFGGDDVVNICIGGLKRDGTGGVNELSDCILEAVGGCNIPGPNLSARIYAQIPDSFLDHCLKVIGTGLGYPALMNDAVNIPALRRHGYSEEDSRDYCMVGCIENFMPGKQPPWSDGRFNVPKYLELALNRGRCALTGVQMGPDTGDADAFSSMEDFMAAFTRQLRYGAAEYMAFFRNENDRYNRVAYAQPYLSCFCRGCIERGLDVNDGGALYPSVHGAGCMGIATVADSLAAVEEVVFRQKRCSTGALRDALLGSFEGCPELRQELLAAPKYGNGDDRADKYAVWYVDTLDSLFSRYRTHDGGPIYIGIASNVQNIDAGKEVGATPDGRLTGQPLSDAASPMRGMDRGGPTAVICSVTKPDYRHASLGTVLNQKFSPSVFSDDDKRAKLRALLRVYFAQGGQEMQINAVSRAVLQDAMEHPAGYESLVVRVSGFSAYYTKLDRAVQRDILQRTEHL